MDQKKTVIVTGFEPFGEHTVNASWVAVQELKKLGLGHDINLHVAEVPVEYQAVQTLLPSLWKQHLPQKTMVKTEQEFLEFFDRRMYFLELQKVNAYLLPFYSLELVVHVGVSGMATTVTLEECGHNHGYLRVDNCSFCPESRCCIEGGSDCIHSVIDMDAVCRRVNSSGLGVTVSVSKDAGRYLCDYTYYTSLYLSKGRSAFVHVPPLGKPYSAKELARALRAVVLEMLEMLEHNDGRKYCLHDQ